MSGITRLTDAGPITDQEQLELLIWSFKISRIKFTYPSCVSILIHD
ncbi:macro domain-containing protein [Paenibacillus sp. FSL R5-0765]